MVYFNNELKFVDNVIFNISYFEGYWKGLVQVSEDKIIIWDIGSRVCDKNCVSLNVVSQ